VLGFVLEFFGGFCCKARASNCTDGGSGTLDPQTQGAPLDKLGATLGYGVKRLGVSRCW
jgi:hypothetical protein